MGSTGIRTGGNAFFGRRLFAIALLFAVAPACGYTLQTSNNPLLVRKGVRKVFVKALVNNTYKAGVENLVYNQLLRTLSVGRRIHLVSKEDEADAVLTGIVSSATQTASASSTAAQLNPVRLYPSSSSPIEVASEYQAVLTCTFDLRTRKPLPKEQSTVLWSASFSRTRPFPASNQIGVLGTTSALINDSEFDRALDLIARSMMDDVHESMLAMF